MLFNEKNRKNTNQGAMRVFRNSKYRYLFWILLLILLCISLFYYKFSFVGIYSNDIPILTTCTFSKTFNYSMNERESINCQLSNKESGNFFCEQDGLWNRRKQIYHIQRQRNEMKTKNNLFFSTNYEPTFHCSFERRFGAIGDGGKWICDSYRFDTKSTCLIYSFGSNNDFTFEIDLKDSLPNCDIHTFDLNKYECPDQICTFHQLKLGNGIDKHTKTLGMIMDELDHAKYELDILKIDIEGGEYSVFPSMFNDKIYPRQIQVEIHHKNVKATHELFDLFAENGYVIFHKEPNLLNTKIFEFALLRLNQQFFNLTNHDTCN
ncbi:unnamed protein product [Didymodactylos carnosus]|uniref:Methyltransferase domain-containing protein n=1 Tax=Didymodactylos carnosus TaxID=1234261 RepID=A0A815NR48_9BILA|nr:unnamed protein product [Didymodactylos carnosus]CAF4315027.1 unnamed protein product [Didymodactylos carnosus]